MFPLVLSGGPCSPGYVNLVWPPSQVSLAHSQVLSIALSEKCKWEGGWVQWECGGGRGGKIRDISEVIALNYTQSANRP